MTITRFAPSPTGTPESVHLGFVIRALWSYAWAKKNNGKFILRIEDTDQVRSRKDTETAIIDILSDFGIKYDELFRQSDRIARYQEVARKLAEIGAAYYDFDSEKRTKEEIKSSYSHAIKKEDNEEVAEEFMKLKEKPQARKFADKFKSENNWQEYLKLCDEKIKNGESFVIRPMIPYSGKVSWEDVILKKKVEFDFKEIQDLVLLKSDGFPTYHLAVVVDDSDMQVTDVMRGFEWLSTTPIHLFLYDSLNLTRPNFWHFPVIMDPRTGKKFSKRDLEGMFGVMPWLKSGYLKEALLNYLMLLGWAPKAIKNEAGVDVYPEIFNLEEFVKQFDVDGIQKANPTFDQKKIDWFQGVYIRKLTIEELKSEIKNYVTKFEPENIDLFTPSVSQNRDIKIFDEKLKLLQERTTLLQDFVEELKLFETNPDYTKLNLKEIKGLENKDKAWFEKYLQIIEKDILDFSLSKEDWVAKVKKVAEENGDKAQDIFMLLRVILWGKQFSPPFPETMWLIGEEKCKERVKQFKMLPL
ncbi:glutamate--tRNA ligase [bacterium]|nr:MAG: glutamate--tRNA ligase [bacterium]